MKSGAGFSFMEVERKFIDLKALKMTDEGPGFIEGYRSVFNVIDEGGDIIVPGAFKDCITEYLDSGFTVHSHDWDFDKVVGFPVEAREDDHGWFVKSQFHSTPDAQNIRIKAKERKEAGKKVGFSFGYAPTEFTHIEAKDYETEIAKYVKAENLPAQLAKAQKFNRIRVLKKVDAIEDSLVTAPMNKHAAATAIKSNLNIEIVDEETKTIRKCKPEDAEPGKPWCLYSADGSKLLGRHATREDAVAQEAAIEANKSEDALLAGRTFEDHSQSVLAAVSELATRAKAIADIRQKEGRAISTSRRVRLSELLAGLRVVSADIEKLLEETEPPPKLDVNALRAQADRINNRLLMERIS